MTVILADSGMLMDTARGGSGTQAHDASAIPLIDSITQRADNARKSGHRVRSGVVVYSGQQEPSTCPSCRCARSICTACFVVWRPRHAADTSTNRRHGFLCRHTASMELAPTQLKLLRSTTTFCRQLKTFLFQSAAGNRL